MPSTGDIAVLRYGNDEKWHWSFLAVSGGTSLFFDASAATRIAALPMSSMSMPVKTCVDAITAMVSAGDYAAYFTSLATQAYVTAAIASLTAGSPSELNQFIEVYNRFLTDESAASAINAALAMEASDRTESDSANSSAIASEASTRAESDTTNSTAISVHSTRLALHPFSFTVNPIARRSGHFNLTVPSGLSAFSTVDVRQSSTPGTNKGIKPSGEFDQILVLASILDDVTLRCDWVAPTGPIIGNFNFYYQLKA